MPGNLSDLNWALLDEPPEPAPVPDQVREAMRGAGIDPPEAILVDGRLHRFGTKENRLDDAGWYIIFPGEIAAGSFGDWRSSTSHNFRQDVGRQLSPAEKAALERHIAEAQAAREADLNRRHMEAAARASRIWDSARPAPADHPYLARKGIEAHGARVAPTGELLLPIYSPAGELSSLQYIPKDEGAKKKFLPGGAVAGSLWAIGDLPAPRVYIAEGFATAASIREATGRPVVIAYSAGNLPAVAAQVRADLPTAELVIVADNDLSGTGQAKAQEAAERVGARIVIPPTPGQDANDFARAGGDLRGILEPAPDRPAWLISALEWAKQGPPVEWVLKGILQRGELHMVHGPSGCGKTFVVLDWILSVASGCADWQGRKIASGGVVYLAGEGHYGLRARIAAWMQKKGATPEQFWLSRSATTLNRPGDLAQAVAEIRALPTVPRVIVVDTLHRFYEGNENAAEETKGMIDACALLSAEFDRACIILVHHTGVSEEAQTRARGSSSWKGALQLEYSVRPHGRGIVVQQMKNKDGELQPPQYATLEPVEIDGWFDEDGDPVTSVVPAYGDEPKDAATDKHRADMRLLFDAWQECGAESSEEGRQYIARSALREWLISKRGKSPEAAKKDTNCDDSRRLIGRLAEAKLVEIYGDGFCFEWGLDD